MLLTTLCCAFLTLGLCEQGHGSLKEKGSSLHQVKSINQNRAKRQSWDSTTTDRGSTKLHIDRANQNEQPQYNNQDQNTQFHNYYGSSMQYYRPEPPPSPPPPYWGEYYRSIHRPPPPPPPEERYPRRPDDFGPPDRDNGPSPYSNYRSNRSWLPLLPSVHHHGFGLPHHGHGPPPPPPNHGQGPPPPPPHHGHGPPPPPPHHGHGPPPPIGPGGEGPPHFPQDHRPPPPPPNGHPPPHGHPPPYRDQGNPQPPPWDQRPPNNQGSPPPQSEFPVGNNEQAHRPPFSDSSEPPSGQYSFPERPPPNQDRISSNPDRESSNFGTSGQQYEYIQSQPSKSQDQLSQLNVNNQSSHDQNDEFIKNLQLIFGDDFKNNFLNNKQNNSNVDKGTEIFTTAQYKPGQPLASQEVNQKEPINVTPLPDPHIFQVVPVTPES